MAYNLHVRTCTRSISQFAASRGLTAPSAIMICRYRSIANQSNSLLASCRCGGLNRSAVCSKPRPPLNSDRRRRGHIHNNITRQSASTTRGHCVCGDGSPYSSKRPAHRPLTSIRRPETCARQLIGANLRSCMCVLSKATNTHTVIGGATLHGIWDTQPACFHELCRAVRCHGLRCTVAQGAGATATPCVALRVVPS